MAYRITPQERRAMASRKAKDNRYNYNPQKNKSKAVILEEKNKENAFKRILATSGDISANLTSGMIKGLEGIYDSAAAIIGGIGGIFNQDFNEKVKEHISYDFTGEHITKQLQERTKASYLNDLGEIGGIVQDVASGVGQMLPAVLVSVATGGAGGAALATMGVSATGNSTEEAFNDGAGYYQGLGYGILSGGVEVATEKIFGGATKSLFGKGMLDNVGKSVADTGLKRVAKNALEEGVEEVASELLNPALKGIYKGKETLDDYTKVDYWKSVGKAGIVGSLTALAYSGTVGYGMSKAGVGYVGREADINDSLIEIETQKKKADNLFANDKLTEKNEATITSNLKGNYQNIENALKKASEKQRAKMIEKFSLNSAFDTDGSIKADFASKIGLINDVEQVSEDESQEGSKPLASLDKRYYTPSLRGSEQTIQEQLGKITSSLQEAENITSQEEGREAKTIAAVTPFAGELSDNAKVSYSKLKKGLNYLNQKSGGKVNVVVVNPHESFNGNLYNDSTIYIGADTLENGKWAGTIVHEYTHFAEGSKDYNRLINFIREDSQLFEMAAQTTARAGYMSLQALDTIMGKIEAGNELTVDEARSFALFQSEINAHMTETLLGNEAFINKIVRGDTTIAEKVLNKINDLKTMFRSFDSKEARTEYKELEKAERLYLKAVESAGYKYSNRKIIRTKRDEIDTEDEIQYNDNAQFSRKRVEYISYAKIGKENIDFIKGELGRLYRGIDNGIADGVAIENGRTVYIVDSGKEDGNITFGVRLKLTIYNDELRKDYVRRQNNESISKRHISDELSSRLGNEYADNRTSNRGQQVGAKLSTDSSKPQNKQGRVLDKNGNQGTKRLKFSLKDSEGQTLTEQQAEYFKDSKVRDENGNLQVVYHGTPYGKFYKFKGSKLYFFSTNESFAREYAKTKSFDNELDAEAIVLESYLNVQKLFDINDENCENYLRQSIEGDIDLGFARTRYNVDKYISLLKGNYTLQPKWTKEQIKNATFGKVIGSDRDGNNTDVFVGVDKNNDVVYVNNIDGRQLRYITEDEKAQLLNGEKIVISYYTTENLGEYHTQFPSGWMTVEQWNEFCDKYPKEKWRAKKHKDTISPWKTTQDTQLLTEQDNWSYFELSYIIKNNEITTSIIDLILSGGYDGIKLKEDGVDNYAVKASNQIKLTTNQNPTENEDIRFAKKEKKPYYKLTRGQLKKIIANNTKYKVYNLADSETIINNVLSNYMSFGDKYGELSGKTKKQVIDMLWKGLNSADPGYQMNVAINIADYIIQNGVLESVWGDEDSQWAVDTIDILKPYLHSLDLTSIKGEIKRKYDTDNSPYLLWGKRKGARGIAPGVAGQEIGESMQIDAINEADIFFQIDEAYRSAVRALKKKAKTFLTEGLSTEELKSLRQEIAKEVLRGFDYTGGDSKLANIVNKYTDRIRILKEQLRDEKARNSVINRLLNKTQKLKDLKLGTFLNKTEFKNDIFKGSIEKLAGIKFRGDLNQSGTRKIVVGLAEWYVESNPILEGVYEDEIGSILTSIANGEGKLTTEELRALANAVDYFKHFVETYNKVLRNGQYVEAQPIAEKYIEVIRENKAVKVGWFNKLTGSSYIKTFGDPMTVARRMDMYESGFYTEMLDRLRESSVSAAVDEMEIRTELDEFLKKNKKYLKETEKRTIKYLGKDIPLMDGLYVYMALDRKQAQIGLQESGFTFKNDKETIRVDGFNTAGMTVESARESVFNQLIELDKQYIEIAKKIFNEECKERKRKTDIIRMGYSNIAEGGYIPIRRANIAHNVDSATFIDEVNRVSNASFNKDTVQGAKQELFVEPLNEVIDRHIHAVAQYANLSTTIDEYNKIFNLDISGNKNKPTSISTEGRNTWKDGDEYFKKLISDIQGISTTKGVGIRAISYIRGSYAKYQLGFNPKVLLTQLTSFAASGSILDIGSIFKGLGISSKDVDQYCSLAKLRNHNNTAAMAQGVIDNVGKVGDVLMKPIGIVDRFVVKKLFGACQIQVEKENGLTVGTEENKMKAGELLKEVILETQQNSMATERSAAMRSGSEFMKTITMFSADAMKVVGRVIDSVGELATLRSRRKLTTDPAKVVELDKRIKVAQKKTSKSVASLVSSAVIMALIAQLFRTLYNKDDEDDNIAKNMAIDAIGNLIGGLPLIRDIYSRFTQGYEISGYAYSALNDLLDTGVSIFEAVGDIFSGKADSKDIALNVKKMMFAGGQILGLPTRNIYNMIYGLTKRISPSAAYKIDDAFYTQSYKADLARAIENEDDSMIATIVGIMLKENIGGIEEASVREEMNSLVKSGYNVLPKSIGDKITYESEEITLTNKQRKQFKAVYSEANSKVASLLNISQYKSATEEVRAKAIKYIYDIYYNLALEDLLGVDLENKNLLFAEAIEIEKLAIIIASARELTADTDKNGKMVSGSKKAKVQAYVDGLQLSAVQKYMIMGYLGYTNAKGKNQVEAYIQRLGLSKTQKEQLFAYSGYAS